LAKKLLDSNQFLP